jgi:hypothetical protein
VKRKVVKVDSSEQLDAKIASLVARGLVERVGTAPDGNPIWGLSSRGRKIAEAGGNVTDHLEKN